MPWQAAGQAAHGEYHAFAPKGSNDNKDERKHGTRRAASVCAAAWEGRRADVHVVFKR